MPDSGFRAPNKDHPIAQHQHTIPLPFDVCYFLTSGEKAGIIKPSWNLQFCMERHDGELENGVKRFVALREAANLSIQRRTDLRLIR